MTNLILGVALFCALHLIPLFAPNIRETSVGKIGEGPYKGIFALATFASFYLMVMGWQTVDPINVYEPPMWGRHVTPLFALIGIMLFVASNAPTNIRRALRHPQLTGVAIWAAGHLFSNGESRSIVLFGGMFLYCVLAIIGSNKRDGEWVKRDTVPRSRDIITVIIGLAVTGALVYFHETFTGLPAVL